MPPLKHEQFPGLTKEKEEALEKREWLLTRNLRQSMEGLVPEADRSFRSQQPYVDSQKTEYQTEDQRGTQVFTRAWVRYRHNLIIHEPISLVTSVVYRDEAMQTEVEGEEREHFQLTRFSGLELHHNEIFTLEERVELLEAATETIALMIEDAHKPPASATIAA